jgi:hypothetical protein
LASNIYQEQNELLVGHLLSWAHCSVNGCWKKAARLTDCRPGNKQTTENFPIDKKMVLSEATVPCF